MADNGQNSETQEQALQVKADRCQRYENDYAECLREDALSEKKDYRRLGSIRMVFFSWLDEFYQSADKTLSKTEREEKVKKEKDELEAQIEARFKAAFDEEQKKLKEEWNGLVEKIPTIATTSENEIEKFNKIAPAIKALMILEPSLVKSRRSAAPLTLLTMVGFFNNYKDKFSSGNLSPLVDIRDFYLNVEDDRRVIFDNTLDKVIRTPDIAFIDEEEFKKHISLIHGRYHGDHLEEIIVPHLKALIMFIKRFKEFQDKAEFAPFVLNLTKHLLSDDVLTRLENDEDRSDINGVYDLSFHQYIRSKEREFGTANRTLIYIRLANILGEGKQANQLLSRMLATCIQLSEEQKLEQYNIKDLRFDRFADMLQILQRSINDRYYRTSLRMLHEASKVKELTDDEWPAIFAYVKNLKALPEAVEYRDDAIKHFSSLAISKNVVEVFDKDIPQIADAYSIIRDYLNSLDVSLIQRLKSWDEYLSVYQLKEGALEELPSLMGSIISDCNNESFTDLNAENLPEFFKFIKSLHTLPQQTIQSSLEEIVQKIKNKPEIFTDSKLSDETISEAKLYFQRDIRPHLVMIAKDNSLEAIKSLTGFIDSSYRFSQSIIETANEINISGIHHDDLGYLISLSDNMEDFPESDHRKDAVSRIADYIASANWQDIQTQGTIEIFIDYYGRHLHERLSEEELPLTQRVETWKNLIALARKLGRENALGQQALQKITSDLLKVGVEEIKAFKPLEHLEEIDDFLMELSLLPDAENLFKIYTQSEQSIQIKKSVLENAYTAIKENFYLFNESGNKFLIALTKALPYLNASEFMLYISTDVKLYRPRSTESLSPEFRLNREADISLTLNMAERHYVDGGIHRTNWDLRFSAHSIERVLRQSLAYGELFDTIVHGNTFPYSLAWESIARDFSKLSSTDLNSLSISLAMRLPYDFGKVTSEELKNSARRTILNHIVSAGFIEEIKSIDSADRELVEQLENCYIDFIHPYIHSSLLADSIKLILTANFFNELSRLNFDQDKLTITRMKIASSISTMFDSYHNAYPFNEIDLIATFFLADSFHESLNEEGCQSALRSIVAHTTSIPHSLKNIAVSEETLNLITAHFSNIILSALMAASKETPVDTIRILSEFVRFFSDRKVSDLDKVASLISARIKRFSYEEITRNDLQYLFHLSDFFHAYSEIDRGCEAAFNRIIKHLKTSEWKEIGDLNILAQAIGHYDKYLEDYIKGDRLTDCISSWNYVLDQGARLLTERDYQISDQEAFKALTLNISNAIEKRANEYNSDCILDLIHIAKICENESIQDSHLVAHYAIANYLAQKYTNNYINFEVQDLDAMLSLADGFYRFREIEQCKKSLISIVDLTKAIPSRTKEVSISKETLTAIGSHFTRDVLPTLIETNKDNQVRSLRLSYNFLAFFKDRTVADLNELAGTVAQKLKEDFNYQNLAGDDLEHLFKLSDFFSDFNKDDSRCKDAFDGIIKHLESAKWEEIRNNKILSLAVENYNKYIHDRVQNNDSAPYRISRWREVLDNANRLPKKDEGVQKTTQLIFSSIVNMASEYDDVQILDLLGIASACARIGGKASSSQVNNAIAQYVAQMDVLKIDSHNYKGVIAFYRDYVQNLLLNHDDGSYKIKRMREFLIRFTLLDSNHLALSEVRIDMASHINKMSDAEFNKADPLNLFVLAHEFRRYSNENNACKSVFEKLGTHLMIRPSFEIRDSDKWIEVLKNIDLNVLEVNAKPLSDKNQRLLEKIKTGDQHIDHNDIRRLAKAIILTSPNINMPELEEPEIDDQQVELFVEVFENLLRERDNERRVSHMNAFESMRGDLDVNTHQLALRLVDDENWCAIVDEFVEPHLNRLLCRPISLVEDRPTIEWIEERRNRKSDSGSSLSEMDSDLETLVDTEDNISLDGSTVIGSDEMLSQTQARHSQNPEKLREALRKKYTQDWLDNIRNADLGRIPLPPSFKNERFALLLTNFTHYKGDEKVMPAFYALKNKSQFNDEVFLSSLLRVSNWNSLLACDEQIEEYESSLIRPVADLKVLQDSLVKIQALVLKGADPGMLEEANINWTNVFPDEQQANWARNVAKFLTSFGGGLPTDTYQLAQIFINSSKLTHAVKIEISKEKLRELEAYERALDDRLNAFVDAYAPYDIALQRGSGDTLHLSVPAYEKMPFMATEDLATVLIKCQKWTDIVLPYETTQEEIKRVVGVLNEVSKLAGEQSDDSLERYRNDLADVRKELNHDDNVGVAFSDDSLDADLLDYQEGWSRIVLEFFKYNIEAFYEDWTDDPIEISKQILDALQTDEYKLVMVIDQCDDYLSTLLNNYEAFKLAEKIGEVIAEQTQVRQALPRELRQRISERQKEQLIESLIRLGDWESLLKFPKGTRENTRSEAERIFQQDFETLQSLPSSYQDILFSDLRDLSDENLEIKKIFSILEEWKRMGIITTDKKTLGALCKEVVDKESNLKKSFINTKFKALLNSVLNRILELQFIDNIIMMRRSSRPLEKVLFAVKAINNNEASSGLRCIDLLETDSLWRAHALIDKKATDQLELAKPKLLKTPLPRRYHAAFLSEINGGLETFLAHTDNSGHPVHALQHKLPLEIQGILSNTIGAIRVFGQTSPNVFDDIEALTKFLSDSFKEWGMNYPRTMALGAVLSIMKSLDSEMVKKEIDKLKLTLNALKKNKISQVVGENTDLVLALIERSKKYTLENRLVKAGGTGTQNGFVDEIKEEITEGTKHLGVKQSDLDMLLTIVDYCLRNDTEISNDLESSEDLEGLKGTVEQGIQQELNEFELSLEKCKSWKNTLDKEEKKQAEMTSTADDYAAVIVSAQTDHIAKGILKALDDKQRAEYKKKIAGKKLEDFLTGHFRVRGLINFEVKNAHGEVSNIWLVEDQERKGICYAIHTEGMSRSEKRKFKVGVFEIDIIRKDTRPEMQQGEDQQATQAIAGSSSSQDEAHEEEFVQNIIELVKPSESVTKTALAARLFNNPLAVSGEACLDLLSTHPTWQRHLVLREDRQEMLEKIKDVIPPLDEASIEPTHLDIFLIEVNRVLPSLSELVKVGGELGRFMLALEGDAVTLSKEARKVLQDTINHIYLSGEIPPEHFNRVSDLAYFIKKISLNDKKTKMFKRQAADALWSAVSYLTIYHEQPGNKSNECTTAYQKCKPWELYFVNQQFAKSRSDKIEVKDRREAGIEKFVNDTKAFVENDNSDDKGKLATKIFSNRLVTSEQACLDLLCNSSEGEEFLSSQADEGTEKETGVISLLEEITKDGNEQTIFLDEVTAALPKLRQSQSNGSLLPVEVMMSEAASKLSDQTRRLLGRTLNVIYSSHDVPEFMFLSINGLDGFIKDASEKIRNRCKAASILLSAITSLKDHAIAHPEQSPQDPLVLMFKKTIRWEPYFSERSDANEQRDYVKLVRPFIIAKVDRPTVEEEYFQKFNEEQMGACNNIIEGRRVAVFNPVGEVQLKGLGAYDMSGPGSAFKKATFWLVQLPGDDKNIKLVPVDMLATSQKKKFKLNETFKVTFPQLDQSRAGSSKEQIAGSEAVTESPKQDYDQLEIVNHLEAFHKKNVKAILSAQDSEGRWIVSELTESPQAKAAVSSVRITAEDLSKCANNDDLKDKLKIGLKLNVKPKKIIEFHDDVQTVGSSTGRQRSDSESSKKSGHKI